MKIRNLNHQTLAQLYSTSKSHFKLYKSGKTWVVAGLTTIFFGMGFVGLPQTVHAATATTSTVAETSSSVS
ncbi:KxYKxGKxW signal peptide domain-containing protein [Loigolactobacillus bifermentans]|uniref:Uncharacterized protein n=1 Tax=Loigolactobacillus bifermentans DSM 20003 TaxID=1423726 RepID=A0A0R1GF77_9LACO|nr:KxYKxGKxW signal peptide domain-containing protein [Loigolactobacillus bifermentans]KRK32569.1 hypothetical protein FC07_GL001994 [Loigolactobacillus bifermentans DSM 20003]QGG60239.1 hypothetical protein LB003_07095 [Loigolactobacillus bifermentans]